MPYGNFNVFKNNFHILFEKFDLEILCQIRLLSRKLNKASIAYANSKEFKKRLDIYLSKRETINNKMIDILKQSINDEFNLSHTDNMSHYDQLYILKHSIDSYLNNYSNDYNSILPDTKTSIVISGLIWIKGLNWLLKQVDFNSRNDFSVYIILGLMLLVANIAFITECFLDNEKTEKKTLAELKKDSFFSVVDFRSQFYYDKVKKGNFGLYIPSESNTVEMVLDKLDAVLKSQLFTSQTIIAKHYQLLFSCHMQKHAINSRKNYYSYEKRLDDTHFLYMPIDPNPPLETFVNKIVSISELLSSAPNSLIGKQYQSSYFYLIKRQIIELDRDILEKYKELMPEHFKEHKKFNPNLFNKYKEASIHIHESKRIDQQFSLWKDVRNREDISTEDRNDCGLQSRGVLL